MITKYLDGYVSSESHQTHQEPKKHCAVVDVGVMYDMKQVQEPVWFDTAHRLEKIPVVELISMNLKYGTVSSWSRMKGIKEFKECGVEKKL